MLELLAAAAAPAEPPMWASIVPFVGMAVIFWFLLLRPQMKRQKEHAAKVAAVKRNDQVVTAGGIVGKVTKVDDSHVEVEIAPNVRVKVVKATLGDVILPNSAPAND